MPTRILREGILDSKAVAQLSDDAEILYRRIMSVADDFGRWDADVELLRARCFPRILDRWPLDRISNALAELGTAMIDPATPLVTLYTVAGKNYLVINNFNQRIRDKSVSKFPDPPASHITSPQVAAERGGSRESAEVGGSRADANGVGVGVVCEGGAGDAVGVGGRAGTAPTQNGNGNGNHFLDPNLTPDHPGFWAEAWYERHPKKRGKMLVFGAVKHIWDRAGPEERPALFDRIDAAHVQLCASKGWRKEGGDFAPKLAEWLADEGWTQPLEDVKLKSKWD